MNIKNTIRLQVPNGSKIVEVTDVAKAFEPGFYCGFCHEEGKLVKFHYHDVLKAEAVDDGGKVVETTVP